VDTTLSPVAAPDAALRARLLAASRSFGAIGTRGNSMPSLLSALYRADADPAEVGRLIGSEPALAARVLRVANSAYYGAPRAIASIDRAVLLLGFDAVRGIAAAACLESAWPRQGGTGSAATAMLTHSVATALAAESVALEYAPALAGEAFVAGLLHDVGVVLQARMNPAGFARFVEWHDGALETAAAAVADAELGACEARELGYGEVVDAERRLIGVEHGVAAGVVFADWLLPPALVDVARHHHAPEGAPPASRSLVACVHVADRIATGCRLGASHDGGPHAGSPEVAALLGVDDAVVERVGRRLTETVPLLCHALVA
jgi:HD-like signal output (HDOD) protein